MQSDRSVVRKHCCVVILFSVVFFSLFKYVLVCSLAFIFFLWSEINVDDNDDDCELADEFSYKLVYCFMSE